MILRFGIISSLVALGMLSLGCQSPKADSKAATRPLLQSGRSSSSIQAKNEAEERAKRVEAMARMMTGNSYELGEKPERALEEYYQSALLYPSNQTFLVDTARKLLQNDQAERAIHILAQTTNCPNASGNVYALLARAHLQTGATNQALVVSQAALKKRPDSLPAFASLAEIYFQIGQPLEAIKFLEQAAQLPEADAVFLINLAETYAKYLHLQPGESAAIKQKAVAALHQAAKLEVKSPNLLQKLADTFNQFEERAKAAEIYLELIEDYADLPLYRDMLREKLANIYLLAHEKEKAVAQLEAMIRDNPTRHPQAYHVLGMIAFTGKKFARAADHFSKAIMMNPDLEQAYYELAGAQINLNQGAAALQTLERAKAKFPQNFVNEFYSGLANQRMKNYEQALKHYTTAEIIAGATAPKHLDHAFYFQVGACFERNQQLDPAEKYFRKAMELKPDDAETLNYLGYMWAENGVHLEKARELIEKAVQLTPKNGAYLDSLGWVLFQLQQPEKALPYLLQALEFLPEPDPTVLDHLGDVYFALKKNDQAREAWRKSLELEPNDKIKKKLAPPL